jgi:hypothetical protein
MSTRQQILGAIQLLERDGWRKDDYGPMDPDAHAPRCVEGALMSAGRRFPESHPESHYGTAVDVVREAIRVRDPARFADTVRSGINPLVGFNDDPATELPDVLAVLRAAVVATPDD